MKKNHLSLLIIISTLFCILNSCNDETIITKSTALEEINLENSKSRKLSDLIADFRIIRLDRSESSLVASANQVQVDSLGIFILDSNRSKSLYSFSLQGNLNYKINRYGSGPGEYTLNTFFITTKDSIILRGADQKKFIYLSRENGDYLSEETALPEYLISGINMPNQDFFIVANDHHFNPEKFNSLYILNRKFEIIDSIEDNSKISSEYLTSYRPISNESNGSTLYKNALHDVIYDIDSKTQKITPLYKLSIPQDKYLTKEDFELSLDQLFEKQSKQPTYTISHSTSHTPDILSIGLAYGAELNHGVIYSKKSRQVQLISEIENDIFNFDLITPITGFNEYLVIVVEPESISGVSVLKDQNNSMNFEVSDAENLILVLLKFEF